MDKPTYANVLIQLTTEIDSISNHFIFKGYDALAQALAKPLAGLCVLSIILLGYGMLRGLIQTPLQELSKLIFRIGTLYLFAMNWGFFSEYVVTFFINGASELSAVLMKASSMNSSLDSQGINGGLQQAFVEIIRVGAWTWQKASFKHWGPIFTAIMIYLTGLIVVGLALFEIITAKLMVTICLATSPLFLCFTLFEKTKSFFDRWLGYLVGFSLVLLFVSSVIGLTIHLIHWAVGGHYATHAANISSLDWIPLAVIAIFCVMAISEVTSLAKGIGGACSTGGGAAMVGGFIGGALGASGRSKSFAQKSLAMAQQAMPGNLHQLKGMMQAKGGSQSAGIQHSLRGHHD